MKKTLISVLVTAFAMTPFLGFTQTANAGAPLAENSAFRTVSNSAVYWHANGVRYPFPNAETYFTWFDSFNTVRVVHDSYLQEYPLAGENITYRPGAKLVKSTSGDKIYAVSRHGILRHVVSASVASQLYGYDWNTKVHDIPDAFFGNYTIGSPIYSASDYNASNEYHGVTFPHESLRNSYSANTNYFNNYYYPNTNYYGTTGSLTFNTSRTNINSGQDVTLTTYYNGNLPSNGRIEIKNIRNSATLKTCYSNSCSVTVRPERNIEGTSVQYIATVKNSNGSFITNKYSPTIYIDSNTNNPANGDTTLSITNRYSANGNETITFAAFVNRSGYTNSNTTLRVYDASNGSLVHTCTQNTYCSFSRTFSNALGKTWYVRATNANGDSIDSNYLTFNTSGNGTSVNNGTLSLTADRTNISNGQAVYLSANYQYGGTSINRIEIKEVRNGNTVKTCYNTSCSATVYPYQNGYTSTQYYAIAYNYAGTQIDTEYSPTIYFNGTTYNPPTYNPPTYYPPATYYGTGNVNDLRIDMSDTLIHSGDLVKLTVNAHNTGNWNYSGNRIEIIDTRTGNIVRTCSDQSWCVADVRVFRNGGEATVRYEARFYDRNGTYSMNEIGTPIYFITN